MSTPRRRTGFSLLELLIVVVITAALVGVAVPFGCGNLTEAQQAKCHQDLLVIRKALELYREREGTQVPEGPLNPLLGRYMQEIPLDAWGNEYLYSPRAGVVGSLGADRLPGGRDGDADILVRTSSPTLGTTDTEALLLSALWLPRCDFSFEQPDQGSWLQKRSHRSSDGHPDGIPPSIGRTTAKAEFYGRSL